MNTGLALNWRVPVFIGSGLASPGSRPSQAVPGITRAPGMTAPKIHTL